MPIWSKEHEYPIVTPEIEPSQKREKLPESSEYLEWVEKEAELKKPVKHGGQILVTSPAAEEIKIVLPLKAETFANPKNWHKGVSFAIRWLLEFAKRQIKKYPNKTVFQQ